jgi:hypothetical protein
MRWVENDLVYAVATKDDDPEAQGPVHTQQTGTDCNTGRQSFLSTH